MGTIGDLLGLNLEDFEPEATKPQATASEGEADAVAEAVWAAILDETGLEPRKANNTLSLAGDLDMDELSLWAVVAMVERDLKCTIPDTAVEAWTSVADIIQSATRARG